MTLVHTDNRPAEITVVTVILIHDRQVYNNIIILDKIKQNIFIIVRIFIIS